MMNIVAPCPQKPTSVLQQHWHSTPTTQQDEVVDDACYELRQILLSHGNTMNRLYCNTTGLRLDDPISTRTNHPLPSFTPLHQGVTAAAATANNNNNDQHRPRSLSVGNTRPVVNLVH